MSNLNKDINLPASIIEYFNEHKATLLDKNYIDIPVLSLAEVHKFNTSVPVEIINLFSKYNDKVCDIFKNIYWKIKYNIKSITATSLFIFDENDVFIKLYFKETLTNCEFIVYVTWPINNEETGIDFVYNFNDSKFYGINTNWLDMINDKYLSGYFNLSAFPDDY